MCVIEYKGSGEESDGLPEVSADIDVSISNTEITVKNTRGADVSEIADAIVAKMGREGYSDVKVSVKGGAITGAAAMKNSVEYTFTINDLMFADPEDVVITEVDKEYSSEGDQSSDTAIMIYCDLKDNKQVATALFGFGKDVDSVSFYVSGNELTVAYESTTTIADILGTDGFAGFFTLKDSDGNVIAYVTFD